jgi:ankyrin repeat protein
LPFAKNFKELLKYYDTKYATVRSYHYNNRSPEEILLQASEEGDIQTVYNGFKMHPELRKSIVYNRALKRAAIGGHDAIISLLLEMGADNYYSIYVGASMGGHLDLVKKYIDRNYYGKLGEEYQSAMSGAAQFGHIDVLEYLIDFGGNKSKYADYGMYGAGISGNKEIIEYLISKGATDYNALIYGAIEGKKTDVIREYLSELDNDSYLYRNLPYRSIDLGDFDTVKALIDSGKYNRNHLMDALQIAREAKQDKIANYLEEQIAHLG